MRLLGLLVMGVLGGAVLQPPDALAADTAPPLSVPSDTLAAALHCPPQFDPAHAPVLLVHGTAATSDGWAPNLGAALPPLGYDVCTVDLPDQALGDIQVASEYVVYGARTIAAKSRQPVAMIGHSQGNLEIRWALKWWPDVAAVVSDVISIAGDHHGTRAADLCAVHPTCPAAVHQQQPTSNFLAVLNQGDETPGSDSYTSIWSENDGAVLPPTSSILEGASNIKVQDLCPGRQVDHVGLQFDAVAFAIVLDGLTHPGPADPTRIDLATCQQTYAPGVQPPEKNQLTPVFGTVDFFLRIGLGPPALAEPAIAAYAVVPGAPDAPPTPQPGAGSDVPKKRTGESSTTLAAPAAPDVSGASRRSELERQRRAQN